ncbi:MAG: hypothetical protein M3O76_03070 [Actinomycetota bacterium]|nr:hypothetical protein [Actinomycetota bacterium]
MKAREGKLGLRKRTCCGHDRNSSVQRSFPCGREQSGLADSSLAANDERAATFADRIDQLVEPSQLFVSAEKLCNSRSSTTGGHVHLASSAATLPRRWLPLPREHLVEPECRTPPV